MHHNYRLNQVCSTSVAFDLVDGRVHNVAFTGGCNGNLKAIGKLVEGMPATDVSRLLRGNTCGFKSTSCADQLSQMLDRALGEEKK